MSTEDLVVRARALSWRTRRTTVLDGVDLDVRAGRVHALLGPNGAGKSTLMRAVLGLLTPTAGGVELFGRPWERTALARVGASVDGPSLYGHLSALDNLRVHAHLLGLGRADVQAALDAVDMAGLGRQRARTFSTGMKGRLALAIAMLGTPELLILDEPQNGLDVEGMVALRDLITGHAAAGGTVVVSSHLLGEVAHLADDVTVLRAGRVVHAGSLAALAPDGDLEAAYVGLTGSARSARGSAA